MNWIVQVIKFKWNRKLSKIAIYRKVDSRQSRLVAHPSIFRMFMKGKFDAYELWPLAQSFQNWIVDQSTAHDFTANEYFHRSILESMQDSQRAYTPDQMNKQW